MHVVQIALWYLDSSCLKHMTGDSSRLKNFMKKFIGTVRFGNDYFGAIIGYGDYVIGDSVISRVYYVEGLGHNLFSVGQFCDSDLEVAFRKHTCFVRDLDGVDLIKGSHGMNLYTISVEDMMRSSPICLMSKASKNKSWLWHRRLNHLNFGTLNDLARKDLVYMGEVFEIKGRDSRFRNQSVKTTSSWSQQNCSVVRTDNGTEFVNKDLTDYYESVGITHEKTVLRTPQQNGVAEAVATACYTQNRSLIHTLPDKTPYELVHDKKLNLSFLRVFGALCYPTNDSEDLGKLKAKEDIGFFVGYTPNRKGYRIYNKRTGQIMETIHVTFDELTEQTAHVHSSPGPAPNLLTLGPINSGLVPNPPPAAPYLKLQSTLPVHQYPSPLIKRHHREVIHHHLRVINPLQYIKVLQLSILSTRKQLATDALWCIYNSVLSKVEQKNFKSVVTEDCWLQAMQDKIHEFDQLEVWELVPPPDCAMIIALKWIYKVKLDEYGDVLKNKARLVAK
ncbi:integrase, catalytic region, zinc finger, CCHC-type containing protein [Tanacetum coccineum]